MPLHSRKNLGRAKLRKVMYRHSLRDLHTRKRRLNDRIRKTDKTISQFAVISLNSGVRSLTGRRRYVQKCSLTIYPHFAEDLVKHEPGFDNAFKSNGLTAKRSKSRRNRHAACGIETIKRLEFILRSAVGYRVQYV